jgi:hypothetical protein
LGSQLLKYSFFSILLISILFAVAFFARSNTHAAAATHNHAFHFFGAFFRIAPKILTPSEVLATHQPQSLTISRGILTALLKAAFHNATGTFPYHRLECFPRYLIVSFVKNHVSVQITTAHKAHFQAFFILKSQLLKSIIHSFMSEKPHKKPFDALRAVMRSPSFFIAS